MDHVTPGRDAQRAHAAHGATRIGSSVGADEGGRTDGNTPPSLLQRGPTNESAHALPDTKGGDGTHSTHGTSGTHSISVRRAEQCRRWNTDRDHQRRAGKKRAQKRFSAEQSRYASCSVSAQGARWRVGQGLPPLRVAHVKYLWQHSRRCTINSKRFSGSAKVARNCAQSAWARMCAMPRSSTSTIPLPCCVASDWKSIAHLTMYEAQRKHDAASGGRAPGKRSKAPPGKDTHVSSPGGHPYIPTSLPTLYLNLQHG